MKIKPRPMLALTGALGAFATIIAGAVLTQPPHEGKKGLASIILTLACLLVVVLFSPRQPPYQQQ